MKRQTVLLLVSVLAVVSVCSLFAIARQWGINNAPVIVPSQPSATATSVPTKEPTATPTVTVAPTVTPTPAFVLPPINPELIHWFDLLNDEEKGLPISEQDFLEKFIPELPLDRSMTWGYHGGGWDGKFGCWFVYPWPRVRGYDRGYSVCQNTIRIVLLDGIFYDDLYKIVKPITGDTLNGTLPTSTPDLGAPEQ